ncbi:hypothetical protein HMPREF3201_02422 [Megasphaera sp. MJR8396C]|nr:hypothetical protein HMPREF3201_02422 [Megasphaera sp. MJR8396C]
MKMASLSAESGFCPGKLLPLRQPRFIDRLFDKKYNIINSLGF